MIGRETEIRTLMDAYNASESKFIAIYGRRRVGKTYLVRETFRDKITFSCSGMADVPTKTQLQNFATALKLHGHQISKIPSNWIDAFYELSCFLNSQPGKKKVVFMDELPWMDAPKSSFLPAFENFWNAWASARKDILLIICGSATSWIVKKIFHNRGGLHNRLSDKLLIKPFTLKECEMFARHEKLGLSRKLIIESYMIFGGVAYYWSMLKRGRSLADNINDLFFVKDAKLRDEFKELYSSLFKYPDPYMAIVTQLGKKKVGMTREEIIRNTGLTDNGKIKIYLDDLEACGFIQRYNALGSTVKNTVYQLIDNFTLFYFKFISDKRINDTSYWTKIQNTPAYNNWCGHAFERVCLLHSSTIKKALGIEGVLTNEYSWRTTPKDGLPGAEIDLLMDRNDRAINVIEMKYTKGLFAIDRKYMDNMLTKVCRLRDVTKTSKSIILTMITANGLVDNDYAQDIDRAFTSDILFE